MIGFSLKATSNTIYSRDYEQYTEGDFWLSDAVSVMSKIPGLGLAGKVIAQGSKSKDVINAAFDGLLSGCLSELTGVVNQMGVAVHGTGDTFLAYGKFNFDGNSGFPMVKRFVLDLKRASDAYNRELGDQVMIQICKTIKEFDLKMPFGTLGQLWIEIQF
jgi:hypothetical protein